MSGPETTAQALAREFAALNTATERAHGLLADLRSERALLAAERHAAEAMRGAIRDLINDQCSDAIGDCVKTQLDQLTPAIKGHMDVSRARVEASFDHLKDLYLGMTEGQVPIEDLFIERVAREIIRQRRLP